MSLEQGIKAALVADADVNGLVSGRVAREILKENETLPAIVLSRVSTSQDETLTDVPSLTRVRVQVDLYADSLSVVADLSDKVKALLNGHRGDLGGVSVMRCILQNQLDSGVFDGDEKSRRITQDYQFTLHE